MGDFDFSGQYIVSNGNADRSVGGADVPYNSIYTPNLGIQTSGNLTASTAGNVITLNALDPSGTVYGQISTWMGTVEGGATDYATIAAWGGTLAKSGTTPSYSEISTWMGTVEGGATDYATIAAWGGTLAKSGTTPSIANVASWLGTKAETSFLGTTQSLSKAVSWGGTKANITDVSSWQGTLAKSGTTPSYSGISTWGGTLAKSGTTPSYSEISTWMGTAGGASSSRVLLASGTASTSASMSFTGFLNSSYKDYSIEIIDIVPDAAGRYLYLQTSSNTGGTYDSGAADYLYSAAALAGYTYIVSASGAAKDSKIRISGEETYSDYAAAAAQPGNFCKITLPNIAANYNTKILSYYNAYKRYSDSSSITYVTGASIRVGTKAIIDAIKIYFSAGNIASGVFKLYGEK